MAGMTLAVFTTILGAFVFVSSAGATQIPPTEECVAKSKVLIAEYADEVRGQWSRPVTKRADRKMVRALFEAGCITDTEPFLKKVKAKPFTPECRAAAKEAGQFWAPYTRDINSVIRELAPQLRPVNRQIKKVVKKIRTARKAGSPAQKVRKLLRTRKALRAKERRIEHRGWKKINPLLRSQAYDTFLITTELLSRRCADQIFLFEGTGESKKTPVQEVVDLNGAVVFWSLFFIASKAYGDSLATFDGADAGVPFFSPEPSLPGWFGAVPEV